MSEGYIFFLDSSSYTVAAIQTRSKCNEDKVVTQL